MDDGKGAATYVDVEGGYYISPWKYDVESISLTVTYQGEDYKVKTKDLELDGLTEVKVSVYELDGKVVTSTESAPDDAKKIAKFKIDLEKWTVTAMPKTGDLEMAVKFQYKDAVPADASNADAYPLDTAAQEQAEAPAGSPEPKLTETQYEDVTDTGAYYYKAVQWAAEMDMEYSGTFDPAAPCSRGSAVYFIWKANGSPKAETRASFTDLPETPADGGQYYWPDFLDAVSWAVEQGVTKGTGDGSTFSGGNPCTRGQIVTFLFRAAGGK